MPPLSRRHLISGAATVMAFGGLSRLVAAQDDPGAGGYASEVPGYGRLTPDPAGLFDLPEGFSYTVVSKAGDRMTDGLITPQKMDGMGCFPVDGDRVALVRNHELQPPEFARGAFESGVSGSVDLAKAYARDAAGRPLPGGATTLIYDIRRQRLERSHLSLSGSNNNCAGGATPWGSWLSCEEVSPGPAGRAGSDRDHGWVFEVPSAASGLVDPAPLKAMGRFRHEAVAVDPRTGVIYLTEDEGDGRGLFYRFLPEDKTSPGRGGRLQALGFKDSPRDGDSRNWERQDWTVGQVREVVWIDLDGVDNTDATLRDRGHAKGAAWFARGEGVFYGQGSIYFSCTSGGPGRLGQIHRYQPSLREGRPGEADQPGRLQLFVQPTDRAVMQMPDNIAVAPWGHLFVCEDKVAGLNFLKAVTPQGKVYTVGRQAHGGRGDVRSDSELAGVCFSPDGTVMFVNIYDPGMTLAITGPWARFQG